MVFKTCMFLPTVIQVITVDVNKYSEDHISGLLSLHIYKFLITIICMCLESSCLGFFFFLEYVFSHLEAKIFAYLSLQKKKKAFPTA